MKKTILDELFGASDEIPELLRLISNEATKLREELVQIEPKQKKEVIIESAAWAASHVLTYTGSGFVLVLEQGSQESEWTMRLVSGGAGTSIELSGGLTPVSRLPSAYPGTRPPSMLSVVDKDGAVHTLKKL